MGRLTIIVALALAPAAAGISFTFGGNDALAAATTVVHFPSSPLFWTGSTVGATTEIDELSPCGLIGATVWFTFTGVLGPATVDTEGSDYDTVLAAYTGPAGATDPTDLILIACNDDFFFLGVPTLQSSVTFPIAAGTTYYLQVGGWFAGAGNVQLNPH